MATRVAGVGYTSGSHKHPAVRCAKKTATPDTESLLIPCEATGSFVTLVLPGSGRTLNLAELYVLSNPQPTEPPPPPSPPSPPSPPFPPPVPPSPPNTPPISPGGLFWRTGPPTSHEPYQLYTGWESYRLGDVFFLRSSVGEHLGRWPHSLASQYARATGATGDYNVLARVVSQSHPENQPPSNAVVVQLRVGDVLGENGGQPPNCEHIAHLRLSDCHFDVEKFVNGQLNSHDQGALEYYVKPISYYQSKIATLPSNITRVTIVAGSHHNAEAYSRSSAYIDFIHAFFASRGYAVGLRLGKSPDEDVEYISRAAFYIQGGGGFAKLLAALVGQMGGRVL